MIPAMKTGLFAAFLFVEVANIASPDESVAFEPTVHTERRANLMAMLGDDVLIVAGRYLVG